MILVTVPISSQYKCLCVGADFFNLIKIIFKIKNRISLIYVFIAISVML